MEAGKVAKIQEVELKHLPSIRDLEKRAEVVSENGKTPPEGPSGFLDAFRELD